MSQFERYEYLLFILKEKLVSIRNNDYSMANTQDTSQILPSLNLKNNEDDKEFLAIAIKDSIETLKIYKELRKIISWDSDIPVSDRTAWIQNPDNAFNKFIDSKCRLTFMKWIGKILMTLNPNIIEFKELRLIWNQMRRIEKIWSPMRSKKNIH